MAAAVANSSASEGTQPTSGGYSSGPSAAEAIADPEYLKHWASPAELLEMQTQWHAVMHRSNTTIADLQRRVQLLSEERNQLHREVKQTEKLAALYGASRVEFDRIKQERAAWIQEKAVLSVEFQRALNELSRLRAATNASNSMSPRRANGAHAREAAAGSATTTTTGTSATADGHPVVATRGASIGTTTTTSASAPPQGEGAAPDTSATTVDDRGDDFRAELPVAPAAVVEDGHREMLWLMEEVRRLEFALLEQRGRSHLERVQHRSALQTCQLQLVNSRAQTAVLEQRVSSLQEAVEYRSQQAKLDGGKRQVHAESMETMNRELTRQLEACEAQREQLAARVDALQATHAAELAAEARAHSQQLTLERARHAEAEDRFMADVERLRRSKQDTETTLLARIEQLEREHAQTLHVKSATLAQADDTRRQAMQQASLLAAQLQSTEAELRRAHADADALRQKLDAAQGDGHTLRKEVSRAVADGRHLREVVEQLQTENHRLLHTHHALESSQAAVGALEQELADVRAAGERRDDMVATALDMQISNAARRVQLLESELSQASKEAARYVAKYRYAKQLILSVDDDGSLRRALRDVTAHGGGRAVAGVIASTNRAFEGELPTSTLSRHGHRGQQRRGDAAAATDEIAANDRETSDSPPSATAAEGADAVDVLRKAQAAVAQLSSSVRGGGSPR